MATMNQQILLASRPTGEPTADNFRLVEVPVPTLADGQVPEQVLEDILHQLG